MIKGYFLIIGLYLYYHFFSKLLEKIAYIRLINYIDKHKLLANNYGFRKNHSTSLALLHLHDKSSSAVDERKYTPGLFLDLSKAFDTRR